MCMATVWGNGAHMYCNLCTCVRVHVCMCVVGVCICVCVYKCNGCIYVCENTSVWCLRPCVVSDK